MIFLFLITVIVLLMVRLFVHIRRWLECVDVLDAIVFDESKRQIVLLMIYKAFYRVKTFAFNCLTTPFYEWLSNGTFQQFVFFLHSVIITVEVAFK